MRRLNRTVQAIPSEIEFRQLAIAKILMMRLKITSFGLLNDSEAYGHEKRGVPYESKIKDLFPATEFTD